jgi:hypothetical protein
MPMFQFACMNGHTKDIYAHSVLERACRAVVCTSCAHTMGPVFSPGAGLTYFSEKAGGRVIHNLGDTPVHITSTAQHEKIMKEQGVAWAPARRGLPGCWGG